MRLPLLGATGTSAPTMSPKWRLACAALRTLPARRNPARRRSIVVVAIAPKTTRASAL
ncbi:unnamed protein product [Periconia digitata]|uniref:Uncharacterized protein n=1 Tax=Periconia digitata TaxID=1303443 RepID=A0A9W4XKS0_9PLEO|nr:unnamed protein product [Periconia digitata]